MAFYIACLPSSLVELNSTATMGSDFVWSLNVFDRSHQWSHLFSTALRSQIPSILHAPCNSIWAHYSPRIYATRKGNEAGLSTSEGVLTSNMIAVPPAGGQRRGERLHRSSVLRRGGEGDEPSQWRRAVRPRRMGWVSGRRRCPVW